MTEHWLIMRYSAFSVLAAAMNLLAQRMVLAISDTDTGYIVAVASGTAIGLLLKYILDKRWIFQDESRGPRDQSRKILLYALTGVLTTLIFWGSETAFWLLWSSDLMRELGASLGLTVGYILKYRLDRRFVFNVDRVDSTGVA